MVNERASHSAPPWIDALAAAVAERLAQSPSTLRCMAAMEEELLTLDDVRARLGFSKNDTVVRLVQAGGLPMFKIGGQWRITRKEYRKAALRQFKPLKRSNIKIPISQR